MKKYIVFSNLSGFKYGYIIPEKKFILESARAFQLFFEHQIGQDGRITLTLSETALAQKEEVVGLQEFASLADIGKLAEPELFCNSFLESMVIYKFIVEYEVETRKVLTIYDTHYAATEKKYFPVNVSNLWLSSAYQNQQLDYAAINKEIFYQSIAYGFVKKLYKESLQNKSGKFDGLGEMFSSVKSLYKVNEQPSTVAYAQAFTFFAKNFSAEIADMIGNHVDQPNGYQKAMEIAQTK